jgi:leader peptidase (prepilin peptidase)/N-methyltransferase
MADNQVTALIAGVYILVLILILFVDLRQRRILNAIALPATLLALLVGLIDGRESFLVAFLGMLAGFLFFYLLYWAGKKFYGPGALGFGDVKLAMLLGAMLGLRYVWPALILGLLVAGLTGILLLLTGRAGLRTSLPYGAFLAGAGIVVLVWTTV